MEYTVVIPRDGTQPFTQHISVQEPESDCTEENASFYGASGRHLKALVYENEVHIYTESEYDRESLHPLTLSKANKIVGRMTDNV